MSTTNFVAVSDTVRTFVARDFGLFIDGEMQPAHAAARLDVYDPRRASGLRRSRMPTHTTSTARSPARSMHSTPAYGAACARPTANASC